MKVNTLFLTPSVARILQPDQLPSLETLAIGGEIVSSTDTKQWRKLPRLLEVYGPTECTILSVTQLLTENVPPQTIGRAIGSVAWVVDPDDHECLTPVGAVGELLIEGHILARGYLDDPARTLTSFVSDPSWLLRGGDGQPGRSGRLYKTGDLVRYGQDGTLVYIGRKDNQVKIRGQRVELGEVEHHIRECIPEAAQVAAEVIVPAGDGASPMLAAFLVIALEGQDQDQSRTDTAIAVFPASASIEDALADRLPSYMVPAAFFAIAHMPMSTSGKTDRKRLRELGASFSVAQLARLHGTASREKRAPTTDLERTLQQIWARVLNLDPATIGLDDSFFRLGGDSISAMKLVGLARQHKLTLSVAEIFRHPTIAYSAHAHLTELHSFSKSTYLTAPPPYSLISPKILQSSEFSSVLSTISSNIVDVLPVTVFQDQSVRSANMSSLQRFNYCFFDLGSSLSVSRLSYACQCLVSHYPILRSVFVPLAQQHFQVVLKHFHCSLPLLTVDGDLAEATREFIEAESSRAVGFGLPFTSFGLLHHGTHGYRLVMRLSHAQYDGICLPNILSSLFSAYMDRPLAKFVDFSVYLSYILAMRPISTRYWSSLLAGSRATRVLPRLNPHGINVSEIAKSEARICIPLLPLRGDFTIASTITSAWAIVLSLITGDMDVVFGRLVAGRNAAIPGIQEVAGPCVNIVPVRVRVDLKRTACDLLNAVQCQHVTLGQSDSLGLTEIIEHCTNWEGSSFDSILQHQGLDDEPSFAFNGGYVKVQWHKPEDPGPPQLSIFSTLDGNEVNISISGRVGFLKGVVATALLTALAKCISELISNPDQPLTEWISSVTLPGVAGGFS